MQPLPQQVLDLLKELEAPERLVAHLALVHDVAVALIQALDQTWPGLTYDRQAVLIGAATHDVGKILYRQELTGPGKMHEAYGPALLQRHAFPEEYARFARTHGQWDSEPAPNLEDLLVALADTIWKGKRNERLEDKIVHHLARAGTEELWAIYVNLDEIICPITRDADARLAWHTQQPL